MEAGGKGDKGEESKNLDLDDLMPSNSKDRNKNYCYFGPSLL